MSADDREDATTLIDDALDAIARDDETLGTGLLSEGDAAAAAQLARESLAIADSRSARRLAWLAALLGDRATRAT